MKTFAESLGRPKFDWNEFLTRLEYEYIDIAQAKGLAADWVTCACGNQCEVIPRTDFGTPEDSVLAYLGQEFYYSISDLYFDLKDDVSFTRLYMSQCKARILLNQIEERSGILINRIYNERINITGTGDTNQVDQ